MRNRIRQQKAKIEPAIPYHIDEIHLGRNAEIKKKTDAMFEKNVPGNIMNIRRDKI